MTAITAEPLRLTRAEAEQALRFDILLMAERVQRGASPASEYARHEFSKKIIADLEARSHIAGVRS